jgi:hypothetical protein
MFGTPIIFLLLLHGNTNIGGESFAFSMNESPFRAVGDEVTLTLTVSAENPLNAVGGKITYPTTLLKVQSVDIGTSIVDLWTEEPLVDTTTGVINFSGGILHDSGFIGEANIISVTFTTISEGSCSPMECFSHTMVREQIKFVKLWEEQ